MDIDVLDLQIQTMRGGRKSSQVPMTFDIVRELGEEDFPMLLNPPAGLETVTPLTRLRHTHHQLARLLASGEKAVTCSAILGYAPARISVLKNDPAFKELLEYYKTKTDEQYLDVHSRLAQLGTDAVEEIQARLDETPDSFSNGQLMDLAEMALDRSVAPPKGGKNMGSGPGQAGPVSLVINFQAAKPESGTLQVLDMSPIREAE